MNSSTDACVAAGAFAALHRRQPAGACRRHHRRPDHQDQHQPVLRQDEAKAPRPRPRSSASSCSSFAGKYDGDNDGQVAAIENLISAGAKGILITPSDTKAIVPTIKKARDAGLLVIALDTPLDPIDAADATFATDNFKAGELIGQWAAKTLGDKAKDAKIAFLDALENQPTVDMLRDQGFMTGLRHRRQGPHALRRRDRPAHRRPSVGPGRRGRRPHRRWRTCCRRTPTSTSSTRSTSRPRPAPRRR